MRFLLTLHVWRPQEYVEGMQVCLKGMQVCLNANV